MRWVIPILVVLASISAQALSLQEQEDDVHIIGLMLLQDISRKLKGTDLVSNETTEKGIINTLNAIKSSMRTITDQLSKTNDNLQCIKGSSLKWIRLESGKKYHYSDFWKYSWYEAKAFCENSGGILASAKNEEELSAIYKANPLASKKPWVFSATDIGQSPGNFYWANGSKLENNSSMWLKGSDPDAFGQGKEACVYVNDGKLADATCNNHAYFVCEARPDCL